LHNKIFIKYFQMSTHQLSCHNKSTQVIDLYVTFISQALYYHYSMPFINHS
jgi:hypothetical protein